MSGNEPCAETSGNAQPSTGFPPPIPAPLRRDGTPVTVTDYDISPIACVTPATLFGPRGAFLDDPAFRDAMQCQLLWEPLELWGDVVLHSRCQTFDPDGKCPVLNMGAELLQ